MCSDFEDFQLSARVERTDRSVLPPHTGENRGSGTPNQPDPEGDTKPQPDVEGSMDLRESSTIPHKPAPKHRRKLNLSMWMMLVQIICSLPLTITYTMIQYFDGSRAFPYLDDVNVLSIFLTAVNILIDPIMY